MKNFFPRIVIVIFVLGVIGVSSAEPRIQTKTVEYSAQDAVMKGYLAYDEGIKEKRPAPVELTQDYQGEDPNVDGKP